MSVCLSVVVRKLQAAILARSSQEISETVSIDCYSFLSRCLFYCCIIYEVSMCPARRTANGKYICPASVNHVSYRLDLVVSLNWSKVARRATRTSLDSPHNPTDLALLTPVDIVQTSGCIICALACLVATFRSPSYLSASKRSIRASS